jgi:hypothetical protein
MPCDWFESFLKFQKDPRPHRALDPIFSAAQANAPVFFSVAGPEHNGTLYMLGAPTIYAGIKLNDPGSAADLVGVWLDRVNAIYRYGWIYSRDKLAGYDVFYVESIDAEGGGMQPRSKELPGCVVIDDWLVIASNRSALNRICGRALAVKSVDSRVWTRVGSASSAPLAWVEPVSFNRQVVLSEALYEISCRLDPDSRNKRLSSALSVIKLVSGSLRSVSDAFLLYECTDDSCAWLLDCPER